MKSRAPVVFAVLVLAGCGPTFEEQIGSSGPDVSFEEFAEQTYKEPWQGGVYIVNGDTPIPNDKLLREFYNDLHGDSALVVQRSGGQDVVWSSAQKRNLTYCISDSFGSRKQQVIDAMRLATEQGWEAIADVDFIHASSQDSSCNASNPNVVFDIRPTSGAPYLARAFFPNQSRGSRNVIIDSSAFGSYGWPLANVLVHELGHTLGFRHEHTRPEAGACYEDSSWRELTPYDSESVMHYPQCNGTNNNLTISAWDAEGAAAIYGPPSGDSGGDTEPPPASSGTERTGSASGQVAQGQSQAYQPLSVAAGTVVQVVMTGSGDADLYVRFDAQPTTTAYDCRPYLNGSSETCSLDVPAGVSEAHIMVRGYTAANYSFEATWVEP